MWALTCLQAWATGSTAWPSSVWLLTADNYCHFSHSGNNSAEAISQSSLEELKEYHFLPGLVGVCLFPLHDQFAEVSGYCYAAVLSEWVVVPCFPVPASLEISLFPAHIEDTSLPLQTWQMARKATPTETILNLLALHHFNFRAKGLSLHFLHSSALHCKCTPDAKYTRLSPCITSLAWMIVWSWISSWLLVISKWDECCWASNRLDSRVSFADLHVVNMERNEILAPDIHRELFQWELEQRTGSQHGKWVVWKFMDKKHFCHLK